MPFDNLYQLTLTLASPDETDTLFTNGDSGVRSLNTLQTSLDVATLKRITDVSISIFETSTKQFVPLDMKFSVRAWMDYIATL